jgi:2-polyprenyl-3-methyl-5-hydroxy-6-metoxy-1,4-benzoquinol methylase
LSGIARLLWRPLNELAERERRPIRVLDLASGAGDIVLALDRIARRRGRQIQFAACDLSPRAVAYGCRQAEQNGANVRFFEHDALQGPLPDGYDAIICSLFLHHLAEAEATDLLARMATAAKCQVVVCDLVRSTSAWLLTYVGTRLLTRSSVVHIDGPLSIRAAFTVDEAERLVRSAGWKEWKLRRAWPFRFVLSSWCHAHDDPINARVEPHR